MIEAHFIAKDECSIKRYAHVDDVFDFIYEFEQTLRNYWKWQEFESEETAEFVDKLWDKWHELKSEITEVE